MAHKYTEEQNNFIINNVKGITSKELTERFNKQFGLNLKSSQIKSFMGNNKLTNDVNTRFKKGHSPSNKGKKGLTGPNKTSFKKGNRPHNYKSIGSERVNGDGYIDIKIQDGMKQRNWKGKHVLIWEKHYGPVPKGHVVIFGDGNKRNFHINNLILVSRQQLVILNKNKLIKDSTDLTRTGIIIATIHHKIYQRKGD